LDLAQVATQEIYVLKPRSAKPPELKGRKMLQDSHQPLSVAEVPIRALKAHPHNARTHSKHQIRQIADSIRTFGFTNPVLINQENTIMADQVDSPPGVDMNIAAQTYSSLSRIAREITGTQWSGPLFFGVRKP
jgi:hypothetical protein